MFSKEALIDAFVSIAGFAVGFYATLKIPSFKYSQYVLPVIGVVLVVFGEMGDSVIHEFSEGFGLALISKLIQHFVSGSA